MEYFSPEEILDSSEEDLIGPHIFSFFPAISTTEHGERSRVRAGKKKKCVAMQCVSAVCIPMRHVYI